MPARRDRSAQLRDAVNFAGQLIGCLETLAKNEPDEPDERVERGWLQASAGFARRPSRRRSLGVGGDAAP